MEDNLGRSLWYHTTRSKENKYGIVAVERQPNGTYTPVPFRKKGTNKRYPDNLLWHRDRLKEQE